MNAFQVSNSLLARSVVTESMTSTKYLAQHYSAKFIAQSSAKVSADGYENIFAHPPAKYFADTRQDFIGITTRGYSHHKNSDHCLFTLSSNIGYIDDAPAKSGVRRGNLNILKATHDAPSVFFYVAASQHLSSKALLAYMYSMVMLAELPKGRLVSFSTSISTSVSVTAPIERGNSSGDSLEKLKEIIVMMTIPAPTHFKFVFLSIKRSDATAKPCRIEATAPHEHSARLMLACDYILLFAGRVSVQGVAA
ncbi:host cell division inhibitor Icd-like protein [Photorhabdus heterorhabditis]|nr:host cell division inhibitor Icd-like protein [Photorhabdus heterorhabditis]